jgi:hypothetical protein
MEISESTYSAGELTDEQLDQVAGGAGAAYTMDDLANAMFISSDIYGWLGPFFPQR